jgi:hypothetical protein
MYVPLDKVKEESKLRTGKNTNMRVKTQMGELPFPTLPGKYFQNAFGNADVEKIIRTGLSTKDRLHTRHIPDFFSRTTPIFPKEKNLPAPIKSVETEQRGGIPTRSMYK